MWLTRARLQLNPQQQGLQYKEMDDTEAIQRLFNDTGDMRNAITELRRRVDDLSLGRSTISSVDANDIRKLYENIGDITASLKDLHDVVKEQQENIMMLDGNFKKLQQMLEQHKAEDAKKESYGPIHPYRVGPI